MNPPVLQSIGTVYHLRFMDERIKVEVTRVRENSSLETHAELRIGDDTGQLFLGRVNLTAPRTLLTLAKQQVADYPQYGWPDIFRYIANEVLKAYRAGEEVINMADHAAPEDRPWCVRPFLQEGESTIIYGDGDSGKSWMAIFLSVITVSGLVAANLAPVPTPVLYLDYETDADTFWRRLNLITSALNISIPDGLFYRQMKQRVEHDAMLISQEVLSKNIGLIIIDSAAPAAGEPESAQAATGFFSTLRSIGKTSLTIAHQSKTGMDSNQPFGSIFWRNLSRSNWKAVAKREGDSGLLIGLRHTKSNNGVRSRDRAFSLTFTGDDVAFTQTNPDGIFDETLESADDAAKIARALRRGAMTPQEIARLVSMSPEQVRTVLNRDKDDLFVHAGKGPNNAQKWGLLNQRA